MKKYLLTLLAGMLALTAVGCSASKSTAMSEVDAVTAGQVERMLSEHLYKIDFTRAYPTSGPSFTLVYPYYISVIGDRVESFLPYAGRVFSIRPNGGEGLRFAGLISDYTQSVGKRGRQKISFSVKTDEDLYGFSLTIWASGECSLTVSSSKKQSISFSGNIDLSPEFETVRIK
jgi:hypothetical protein